MTNPAPKGPPSSTWARLTNRNLLILGAIVAVVVGLVADGAIQRPADPVEPLVLHETERLAPLEPSAPLRIATFNTHAGVGRDGVRDLGRTADALRDLDLAALQEVRSPLFGIDGPQVADVAARLQMGWLFVPAERRWWHNHYGNALLTRFPLVDYVRIPLPTPSRQRFRAALLTNFTHWGRTVHVLTVHIDKDEARDTHNIQLRTAFDLFLSLNEPAILLGDLNEFASHPEMVRLLKTPGVHNALANIAGPTVKKDPIDWIFTRGLRTVRAEWIANPASDHPVARADLELAHDLVSQTITAPEASHD
ncbi:MAG TPA: endonuclease/exonuclease/phosphatase family protein [Planctomycetaceae bacterium]|jgi:endonuclease/exonuclease/phosphatase family metal-dependent hydrolase|nr:endonuclease/exonuclease/phosphatase family protein [Planctomycetaceae bacterium]